MFDVKVLRLFMNCVFSQIVYDRVTDRSRGFGFVTLGSVEEAKEAIRLFDGSVSADGICIAIVLIEPFNCQHFGNRRCLVFLSYIILDVHSIHSMNT